MHQIYIAAAVTTIVTAAVFTFICRRRLSTREQLAMIAAAAAYVPIY